MFPSYQAVKNSLDSLRSMPLPPLFWPRRTSQAPRGSASQRLYTLPRSDCRFSPRRPQEVRQDPVRASARHQLQTCERGSRPCCPVIRWPAQGPEGFCPNPIPSVTAEDLVPSLPSIEPSKSECVQHNSRLFVLGSSGNSVYFAVTATSVRAASNSGSCSR